MTSAQWSKLERWAVLVPLLLALALYLQVFAVEWSLNDQYGYGYLVPLISGYLLYLRWQDRPAPGAGGMGWVIASGALICLLLPLRVVHLANPDWRAIHWALALCLYAFALCVAGAVGGRPWVRHFAVALGVLLLAVPWPSGIEGSLTQGLMSWVAGATVELLNLMGFFAERHGNIIRVATGLVGVEEACSGVRSLQSTLMTAVFLGEWFRFGWRGRIGLIGAALAVSLGLNMARTLVLTLVAANRGGTFMQHIHDPVGNMVAVLAFAILLLLALAVRRFLKGDVQQTPVDARLPAPMPWARPAALAILFAAVLSLSWLWFQRGGDAGARRSAAMEWQRVAASVREEPIPAATRAILRYSEGSRHDWSLADGLHCTAFLFTWEQGAISSFAGVHNPELCLPAAGFERAGAGPEMRFERDGLQLRMQALAFSSGGTLFHVYFGVWDVTGSDVPLALDWRGRLANAWRGQRVEGRQSLEIVVTGPRSYEESAAVVHQTLDRALRVQ